MKNGGSEERRTKNEECSQRVPTANFTLLSSLFTTYPSSFAWLHFSLFTLHFSLFTTYPSSFAWLHSSLFSLHSSLFSLHSSPHTQAHSLGYTLHSSLFTQNALPSLSFSSYSFALPAAGGWHVDGEYPLALLCLPLLAGGQ